MVARKQLRRALACEPNAHRSAGSVDAFSKLSRYETSLARRLDRALHELERLQAARAGRAVAVPAVVDVDVSSGPS